MKRHLLLAVLLIFGVALLSTNSIYATLEDQPITNITNSSSTQSINENISNSTSNNTSNNTNNSSENIQEYAAAGDGIYSNVKGFWMRPEDVSNINVNTLKASGITDIFLLTKGYKSTYTSQLQNLINKLNGSGIRVHAWITCFLDSEGKWVDPQGTYSYQVKIPYTQKVKEAYTAKVKVPYTLKYKSWYKSWYKAWYKSYGRWKYTWKYNWKYKIRYKTAYKYVYKTQYKWVNKTLYRYETRTGNNTAFKDNLIKTITDITENYDINGIHLDYVRYPGTAYKYENGTASITSFVQSVYTAVKSVKSKVAVSAALMPEKSVNAYYYGQDYSQLSNYLDFLVPMVYKGNYKANTAWIGSAVNYIVNNAGGKPVIAGLQSYRSDSDVTPLTSTELLQDVDAALNNGANGYALFVYGLIDSNFFNGDSSNSGSTGTDSTTINDVKDAASRVKSFIESYNRLPSYVTVSGKQISMSDFLYLLVSSVLQVDQGTSVPMKFASLGEAPNPSGDIVSANIDKSEYLDVAGRLKTFMESYNRSPNYAIYSAGKVKFDYVVYSFSKIMDFYKSNGRLPNYAILDTKTMGSSDVISSDLQEYLVPTNNCQSDDPEIRSLALSIIEGASSSYEKADRLFKWVRDNLSYTFYYNTKYGATGILKTRDGNCIDHSHLLIAMARSVGIPARYAHAQCEFTTMTVGHVWAELYANGTWYTADATSSRNSLGVMQNCKILYWKGRYSQLPF
ncbi:MAG: transglutaminase domain-containing protein [Methanomicrobiales archaeon]